MVEIISDKNNELIAVIDKDKLAKNDEDSIKGMLNDINLFSHPDSYTITEDYIAKNKKVFEKLIELGIKDLYWNVKYSTGQVCIHNFIINGSVDKPIY